MKRPQVKTAKVADRYSGVNERIVEFTDGRSGGLISFVKCDDGTLRVSLYRLDPKVTVQLPADYRT